MKILHLISSGGMYGAEAVILTLCRRLQELGHVSEIACFLNEHRPNTEFLQSATTQGFAVQPIHCRSRIDLKTVKELRRIIVDGGYDVVHSHNYKADIYLKLATMGLQIPIVATCHTWYDNNPSVWLYGVLDRFLLRSFDKVVSVSPGVSKRLRKAGVRANAIENITNGIAVEKYQNRFTVLRRELNLSPSKVLVGVVARLSREKGICHFLDAIAALGDDADQFEFAIIGEGPEAGSLKQQAERLGISKRLRFLGRREDMPEVFASIDILVQPSLDEGLPISVLEAMASGCTIVATSVGALPAVITSEETGLLISPGNAQEISAALLRTGADPTLRAQLGGSAQRRVQASFSAEEMTRKYLAVYQGTSSPVSVGRHVPSTSV